MTLIQQIRKTLIDSGMLADDVIQNLSVPHVNQELDDLVSDLEDVFIDWKNETPTTWYK